MAPSDPSSQLLPGTFLSGGSYPTFEAQARHHLLQEAFLILAPAYVCPFSPRRDPECPAQPLSPPAPKAALSCHMVKPLQMSPERTCPG